MINVGQQVFGAPGAGGSQIGNRPNPVSVELEMNMMLNGQLPPATGDHLQHLMEHLSLMASTLWGTAGMNENHLLHNHLAAHLNALLIAGVPFTAGPPTIESAVEAALGSQRNVTPST